MPFGRVGADEFGTYFIGYARSPAVIEQMLTNMFVGNPPGTTDRVLDFSTAVTGTLFFVPSSDFLDEPPAPGADSGTDTGTDTGTVATAPPGPATAPPAGPATAPPAGPVGGAQDDSLRIGSLRPPR